jgi:uncharacterized protein YxjI
MWVWVVCICGVLSVFVCRSSLFLRCRSRLFVLQTELSVSGSSGTDVSIIQNEISRALQRFQVQIQQIYLRPTSTRKRTFHRTNGRHNGDRLRHKKGHLKNTLENFYIFREPRLNNQLNDKTTVKPNAIFDVIIQNDHHKGIPTSRNSELQ